MDIAVKVDAHSVLDWLDSVQRRQVPFAASVALNKTARLAQADIRTEMQRVLDRPKPYTLGGTFVKNSTKQSLTAIVGLKDMASTGRAAATYLAPLLSGTPRRQTGWERALRAMGAIPSGMRAVPAVGAKLDGYGNMNRAQVTEIMGSLRSGMRSFKGRGKRVNAAGYFVVMPGSSAHLKPGIYYRVERPGESVIRPVVVFVKVAKYKQTIRPHAVVSRCADRNFKREFDAALASAMATAR